MLCQIRIGSHILAGSKVKRIQFNVLTWKNLHPLNMVANGYSKMLLNADEWLHNVCKCRLLPKLSVSSAIFSLMSQYCERRRAAAAGRSHAFTYINVDATHACTSLPMCVRCELTVIEPFGQWRAALYCLQNSLF